MLGRGLQSLIPPSSDPNQPNDPLLPAPPVEPVAPMIPVEPMPPAQSSSASVAEPVFQPASPVAHPESTVPYIESQPGPQPVFQPAMPVAPAEPAALPLTHAPQSERSSMKIPEAIFQIEVEKIKPNPDQPRRIFEESALRDLASSIREFGLLQPIVVTKVEREVPTGTEVEYVLISGERRLMASKLLGLERIPAIVRNIDFERERLELAIIENIQRENLNPIEVARSFARLQDEFRLTQREIAVRLGKSREVVANGVRLLDLPTEIQEAIEQGKIGESHGRLLLTIDDPTIQARMFRELLEQRLTTRELKQRVDAAKAKANPQLLPKEEMPPELQMLQQKLSSDLGAPVAIQKSGEAGGKITITFYSQEELQSIVQHLEREY